MCKKSLSILCLVVLSLIIVTPVCFAELKCGSARIDITPPVGVWLSGYGFRDKPSDRIQDNLYARAVVLDDGKTKIAIVSCDLLWVPKDMSTSIRQKAAEFLGVKKANILVCGTHTHFGPRVDNMMADKPEKEKDELNQAYVKTLAGKIIDSIKAATEDMKAARVGMIKGELPEVVYNRRTVKPDGSVINTFRLPAADPKYKFGVTDPEVGIIKVEDAGGSLIASLVNFPCHPVSGATDPNNAYSISADYPGFTSGVAEQTEGGVCLFALGTAGNMNPVRHNRQNPRAKIGRALAAETLRKIQFLETTDEIALNAKTLDVEIPLKEKLPEKKLFAADESKKHIVTVVQVLKIGDIYVLGLPGEVLVEIGLHIKSESKIENLIIISIANDPVGYVCHRLAYKQGGYESDTATNLAPGAGELIQEHALKLLDSLK